MKERGIDLEALGRGAKPGAASPAAAAVTPSGMSGVTTIDALFDSLPARVSQGRVMSGSRTRRS